MHPFPQANKLRFLKGTELNHICLGQWQIQFNFDPFQIAVEGELEHVDKAGIVRRHNTDDSRLSPIFLHNLIGQRIQELEVEPFRLTLTFDGGEKLRILSDEGPYECGQIHGKDENLVVF